MLALGLKAELWHCRPSALLELTGVTAYQLDSTCALLLWEHKTKMLEEQNRRLEEQQRSQ